MVDGTDFLQSADGAATITFENSQLKFNVSQYEISSWTDPEISDGESGDTIASGTGNVVDKGAYVIKLNAYNIEWTEGKSLRDTLVEAFKNTTF